MNTDVLERLREELKRNADEKAAEGYQRYFKEKALLYGIKGAVIKKITAEFFKDVKDLEKAEVFALCEDLLKSDYHEESTVAFGWVYRFRDQFKAEDFSLFEGWIKNYVDTWAKCDDFCNHSMAAFVEKYPQYIGGLKRWARSENMWLRRAAAVTLILPARKGKYLHDVFEIADILMMDKEDLVRKGYGWMLKEASRLHRQEVYEYLIRYKDVMPRTAFRYALEKMPEDMRKAAMKKG